MSERSKWRGYVDAQNSKDNATGKVIATAVRKGILKDLSTLIKSPVIEYRSGWMVIIDDLDKQLPLKIDDDYVRGWFKGQGRRYKDPLKLTVTGTNVETFRQLVEKRAGIELPKAMTPNKNFPDSKRVTVTFAKAEQLDEWLRAC